METRFPTGPMRVGLSQPKFVSHNDELRGISLRDRCAEVLWSPGHAVTDALTATGIGYARQIGCEYLSLTRSVSRY
jgi:hypothetical protein